ncbi:RluA family pseudouridine synthase [Hydrogenimonas urashimensis]|uniref:RluA family pseudouridine synthase n=1 Tax=Hydrogenimonas urashimensis TaxID=2740515 RepID=UPI001916B6AD|nr:RluA family pseudouridine synthase [Hydrogenimonas urashimensis]
MAFVTQRYQVEKPMPAFLFLMRRLGVRQGEAQKIVASGRLVVNGVVCENSGEKISGDVAVKQFVPQSRGITPLFSTPDFGLFDKPSGVLVHPTTHRTPHSMLDDIRHVYGGFANAIHRIDMETSGLLLVSRNKAAERRLKTMFEDRGVEKSYLAWVRGRIDAPFDVDVPLKRNDDFSSIKLKVLVDPEGKPSFTHFEPVEYDSEHDATLVRAFPYTGRQHQIRVHLFHVKHPIIGDPIYGVPVDIAIEYLDKKLPHDKRLFYMGAERMLLHAQSLTFDYQGVNYRFESKIDFENLKRLIVKPSQRAAMFQ